MSQVGPVGGSINQYLVVKLLPQNPKKTKQTKYEARYDGNVMFVLF